MSNPWEANYEIKNKEIQELLLELGRFLNTKCPPGWGFALEIFQFQGEAFFYLSNADRKDMVKALREFISREGQ